MDISVRLLNFHKQRKNHLTKFSTNSVINLSKYKLKYNIIVCWLVNIVQSESLEFLDNSIFFACPCDQTFALYAREITRNSKKGTVKNYFLFLIILEMISYTKNIYTCRRIIRHERYQKGFYNTTYSCLV